MSGNSKDGKQYGLVVPKKASLSAPKPGNIFGEDSGSDADDGCDWVKKALRAEGEKNLVKKQTRLTMKKALTQDPTVYQYDEVYDEMERSKVEEKAVKKEEKKPKYIENLLKAAERRKREQEHRIERMVQKEREAEGAMFADKESFVTAAYRAKLEEFKKMEEEEKNMDRLEAIGDVTKQKDMSGFYRHLFHQTVDGEKKEKDVEAEAAEEKDCEENKNLDQDDPLTSDSGSEDPKADGPEKVDEARKALAKVGKKRQYRKRTAEAPESSSEDEPDKEPENKDQEEPADKQDSKKNSVEEKNEPESKKQRLNPEASQRTDDDGRKNQDVGSGESKSAEVLSNSVGTKEGSLEKGVEEKKEIKDKVSIWQKRTVGPVLEAALERYYVRKAARGVGGS